MQHHLAQRIGSLSEAVPSTSAPLVTRRHIVARAGTSHKRLRNVVPRTTAPDRNEMVPQSVEHLLRMNANRGAPATTTAPETSPQPEQENTGKVALKSWKTKLDEDYHPSQGWKFQSHHLTKLQLWDRIRQEAMNDAITEPTLATFLHSVVLAHNNLEQAMSFLLANKIADSMVLGSVQMMRLFQEAFKDDPDILEAAMADLQCVLDRDPACSKYTQCMLYFKGYQAVQCYRVTHWLWKKGRKALASAIQSRISEIFAVDIHPAARLGRGIMLDHATGIVIGETAVVGDNVSMLHHVFLGGSGTQRGIRHPTIEHGVLLGAGVTVLGNITVGAGSKVGAGSVVVSEIPEHCVAVGVPARIVKRDLLNEPVTEMDQCADFILDYVI